LFCCIAYECFNIIVFDSKDIKDTSTFQDTPEKKSNLWFDYLHTLIAGFQESKLGMNILKCLPLH
jgi:hypothetical protein